MSERTTCRGAYRYAATLAAAILLAGCASGGSSKGTAGAAAESGYAPGSGYHVIMAEIAADRGAEATAAEEYLNAAERSDDPEVSRHAAGFAFDYGFDAYALRAARRWSQVAPAEPDARLQAARLLVRRNDIAGALAQVEQALGPAAGRTAADYERMAKAVAAEENAEGVTRLLSRLAANSPESPQLTLALGAAALRSRDLELSLDCARRVVAAAPGEQVVREAKVLTARALMAQGDTDAAIAALAAQAKADPTMDVELEYAGMLATADRTTEALSVIDGIATRHGNEPAVRRLRAIVALDAEDYKTAWEGFGSLVTESEFADESYFYLGDIALRQQRFDEALQLFARVSDGPFLLTAQDTISRIAEASGDAESALELLERFAQRHPRTAFEAARYRAALLDRLGRQPEALAILNEVARYRPDDAGIYLSRGALLEKMGKVDPAIADMRRAVELAPDNPVTLNALGYTLVNRTRQRDEAYHLVRRALERDASSGAILDSYGWVLYKMRRLPEARSWLELAATNLDDPEIAAHLGEVMWMQGDRDAARKTWQDALEKAPSSQVLKDTMARLAK